MREVQQASQLLNGALLRGDSDALALLYAGGYIHIDQHGGFVQRGRGDSDGMGYPLRIGERNLAQPRRWYDSCVGEYKENILGEWSDRIMMRARLAS